VSSENTIRKVCIERHFLCLDGSPRVPSFVAVSRRRQINVYTCCFGSADVPVTRSPIEGASQWKGHRLRSVRLAKWQRDVSLVASSAYIVLMLEPAFNDRVCKHSRTLCLIVWPCGPHVPKGFQWRQPARSMNPRYLLSRRHQVVGEVGAFAGLLFSNHSMRCLTMLAVALISMPPSEAPGPYRLCSQTMLPFIRLSVPEMPLLLAKPTIIEEQVGCNELPDRINRVDMYRAVGLRSCGELLWQCHCPGSQTSAGPLAHLDLARLASSNASEVFMSTNEKSFLARRSCRVGVAYGQASIIRGCMRSCFPFRRRGVTALWIRSPVVATPRTDTISPPVCPPLSGMSRVSTKHPRRNFIGLSILPRDQLQQGYVGSRARVSSLRETPKVPNSSKPTGDQ